MLELLGGNMLEENWAVKGCYMRTTNVEDVMKRLKELTKDGALFQTNDIVFEIPGIGEAFIKDIIVDGYNRVVIRPVI